MSKMDLHEPFGYLKHKLWPKEGLEVKLALEVGNCPNFLGCRWPATYYWKNLDKGHKFSLDLTSIKGLHTKLWAPKIAKVPI
jgi:hypothetical protein